MLDDVTALIRGFTTLHRYDPGGDVAIGAELVIYCGPGDLEYDEYTTTDRTALEDEGWQFDANIGRWGYQP